jgi:SAM-dependent methyltransferase
MMLYHDLAEYYFALESNHRDIHHDVSFITGLLAARKRSEILDLGCGTGEHLDLLHKAGIRCTGIDVSEKMLDAARKRFPHGIYFIHADMTDIDFTPSFDMVISLFGSFNYLIHDADIASTLQKIHKAMQPDGLGVFEIWNTPPVFKIKTKEVNLVSVTNIDGKTIRRERGFKLRNDRAKTVVDVNYRYTIESAGARKTLSDRHVMRTYTTDEITKFLVQAGFTVKQIFSNFLSEPYDEKSNKMVVIFAR